MLLQKQDFQLNVVDIIANDTKEVDAYRQSYSKYRKSEQELEQLREEIERNRANADFLRFQYHELTSAKLQEGELEELEQKSDTMTHSEEIKSALYTADNELQNDDTGVVRSLRSSISALRNISKVFPDAQELTDRLDSAYIEIKDIASEVSSYLEDIDFDPSELDIVNNRIDKLYDLEKKYNADGIEDLITLRDELKEKLNNIENSDDALESLQATVVKLKADVEKKADILTKLRTKAAKMIEKDMQNRLVPLGMPNVRFSISITKEQPGSNGQDKIAFLFSANTSTPLQPVSQVASGGEIARVMLSLKAMISGAVKLPTIIFDEIDTGVSGKIAEKMAEIMQEMGNNERQVISITHLPQIAALGSTHYKVAKGETAQGTVTSMTMLTAEERVREIAQMLSGSDVTDAAIQNARELLKVQN